MADFVGYDGRVALIDDRIKQASREANVAGYPLSRSAGPAGDEG